MSLTFPSLHTYSRTMRSTVVRETFLVKYGSLHARCDRLVQCLNILTSYCIEKRFGNADFQLDRSSRDILFKAFYSHDEGISYLAKLCHSDSPICPEHLLHVVYIIGSSLQVVYMNFNAYFSCISKRMQLP